MRLYGDLAEVTLSDGSVVKGVAFRVPNPPKRAVLRLPTTEEMIARLDKRKAIHRSLGRGKTVSEWAYTHKADLELFNKIRLDKDGIEFDEIEALAALTRITQCEIVDSQESDDEFRITLSTAFGDVIHTVGKPSERDAFAYRRSALAQVDLPNNQEEHRFPVTPAITLYDAVAKKVEGYAGDIKPTEAPPHHKVAIAALLGRADAGADLEFDPNS